MDTSSSRYKSYRPDFHRSLPPSDRFCSSASSTFSTRHGSLLTRSVSPNRVNLSKIVRFSASRNRSIAVSPQKSNQNNQRKICMCSPTTHPGSFRCSLHKGTQTTPYYHLSNQQLNMRRSAMKNSLARIGDLLVKRALSNHIRPSSHSLRRRANFQLRPSRLSLMSKA